MFNCLKWKMFIVLPVLFFLLASQKCSKRAEPMAAKYRITYPVSAIDFSQDMLLAIKSELPYSSYVDTLTEMNLQLLKKELNTQEKQLSFWINIYNSLVQVRLSERPELFNDKKSFFKNNDIIIGQQKLSLDDIENGIMRLKKNGENKKFINKFKINHLDNRIHFTLNCGATSCPAIAYYAPANLDQQLEDAAAFYVKNNCFYNKESKEVIISELFSWFKEDFNGDDGVIKFLKKYGLIPQEDFPKITYKKYDWGVKPANFN